MNRAFSARRAIRGPEHRALSWAGMSDAVGVREEEEDEEEEEEKEEEDEEEEEPAGMKKAEN